MSSRFSGARRKLSRLLFGRTLVLAYHRISDYHTDPFSICVTPKNFSAHIGILTELGEIISGDQLLRRKQRPRFMITFDDGYLDNFTVAMPFLQARSLPAIFFVVVSLEETSLYWWDALHKVFLETKTLPACMEVEVPGYENALTYEVEPHIADVSSLPQWNISMPPPSKRHRALQDAAFQAKVIPPKLRREFISQLAASAQISIASLHSPTSSPEHWRAAHSAGYEIGSHTLRHPWLPALDTFSQREEITASKTHLEREINAPVRMFAVTHGGAGDYLPSTSVFIKEAGYQYGFAVRSEAIGWRANPFDLPRLYVRNWDADEFRQIILKKLS